MAVTFEVGNLISVRFGYALTGREERCINVLHYQISNVVGAPGTLFAGLSSIATTMHDLWGAAWKPFASEDVTLVGTAVTNCFPLPRSATVISAGSGPAVGEVASDTLPLQDAVTLLKKTELGGRKGYGRIFIPGIPESSAEEGRINNAGITGLSEMIDFLDLPISVVGIGWELILTPMLLGGPEDNPVRMNQIRDAVLSDPIIKTQRRRRPGKGS